MARLPKRMNNGQIDDLKRDFEHTFEGIKASEIRADEIFEWAVNTQAFYNWYYTRFKLMCEKRIKATKSLGSIERSYKPVFLEWATYQLVPCTYADFLNSLSTKINYNDCNKAGNMLYDYYLNMFKEETAESQEA